MTVIVDWLFRPRKPRFAVLKHPDGTFEAVKYNQYGHDFSIDVTGEVMVPSHLRSWCATEDEAHQRIARFKAKPPVETVWQE